MVFQKANSYELDLSFSEVPEKLIAEKNVNTATLKEVKLCQGPADSNPITVEAHLHLAFARVIKYKWIQKSILLRPTTALQNTDTCGVTKRQEILQPPSEMRMVLDLKGYARPWKPLNPETNKEMTHDPPHHDQL